MRCNNSSMHGRGFAKSTAWHTYLLLLTPIVKDLRWNFAKAGGLNLAKPADIVVVGAEKELGARYKQKLQEALVDVYDALANRWRHYHN